MSIQHPKFQTTSDGTLLLNFGEYGQEVEVAAISADGRRLLTVHDVGTAVIWDASSGDKVGELRPDSPLRGRPDVMGGDFRVFIEAAALNRDGSIALLGLNDGTAGTFSVQHGARLATLHPPGEQPAAQWGVIRAVAYSPDGAHALVGFSGRSVGVWSEQGDRLVRFLTARSPQRLVGRPVVRDTLVSSVAMSGDGRWVFAGVVDMTAAIWDAQSGEIVFEVIDHAEDIVALFDDDHGVGWATTGGAVWVSRGGSPPTKVVASGEHWAAVRFDRGRFLTRGYGDEIQRWDLSGRAAPLFTPDSRSDRWFRGAQELLGWDVPVGFETRWCIGRDGRTLTVARNQGVVRFDLDTGAVLGTWAAEITRPDCVPSDAIAIEVEAHAGAALWRTEHGLYMHQSDGPRGWVQPLQLSPDGIVAVPAERGAAVLHVAAGCSLLGVVPFEGKLRASRVVGEEILLVNERGQLFRHRIPARGAPN